MNEESRAQSSEALSLPRVLDALAERARTRYGADRLQALFPGERSKTELETDFDRIEQLTVLIQQGEELPFGGTRDLGDSLLRARSEGSHLPPDRLLDLASTVASARKLREYIVKRGAKLSSLDFYRDFLTEMPEIESEISKKIDEDEAEVADGASPELRRIRQQIEATTRKSRSRLEALVSKYSSAGALAESTWSVREGRYVLPVKQANRTKVGGIVHGSSATGATLFVEPPELVELANELRRLAEQEQREVLRILIELTDLVRSRLHELEAMVDGLGLLDSLHARALLAESWGAMRPRLRSGELTLVQARHPLLLLRKGLDETVPLDLELGGQAGARVLIITGPNAGGKTVALKTVGLAVALTHSAIWPPTGDGTVIPPVEDMHVIIGDDQSLEGDLSSFSGHLEKLRAATDKPEQAKLLLVDEIAAGTDPGEGGAIAMALLEQAIERGWWTIVTTHMGQLKAFAHRTEGVRNGSMQFDRERLTPTYRFQPDIPGSSYAIEIAKRVGLPATVLDRARELVGAERMRLEDLIEELSSRLATVQQRERELSLKLSQAGAREQMLQDRLDRFDETRAERLAEASGEAKKLLADANRTIELTVKELREQQANRESIKAAHERLARQKQKIEQALEQTKKKGRKSKRIEQEAPQGVSPGKTKARAMPSQELEPFDESAPIELGDRVRMEGGNEGEVIALQGKRAQIAAGSLKLWVDLAKLQRVRPPQANRSGGGVHVQLDASAGDEGAPVSTELKLLGKRYEEAETELDGYLQQLAMAGLPHARIVHGKGTGTLRAMVHEKLEAHPLVGSWRLGEAKEGGDGVTILEMRD